MQVKPLVGAVEYILHGLGGKIAYGGFQCRSIFLADGLHLPENRRVLVFSQRGYPPRMNRNRIIGYYLVTVDDVDRPKPLAATAGSQRGVERKIVRSRFAV